jgi:hypothetical protein
VGYGIAEQSVLRGPWMTLSSSNRVRYPLALVLALISFCVVGQRLPPIAEVVGATDATSRRIEPLAKHDLAARIVSPDERRGWLFERDMSAAARNVEAALRSPYDAQVLDKASAECERIANTVYRLFMYAHANANELARAAGRKGSLEYAAPFLAMRSAREGLSGPLKTAVELRDEWSAASRIPPRSRFEGLSAHDLRQLLSDVGLREYARKDMITKESLESLLVRPPVAYKKDQPGWSTDVTGKCARECKGGGWNYCGTCTRSLLENAEASYRYFAAEWNANDRWYQFWRRVELTDNLLGMLGAGYRP